MANDGEFSAATVREYFLKNGGRVKRNDLFDHFRGQLDKFDDQGTSKNRFGDIVNSLASLQNIEGEKYFVLKKATPTLLRRPVRQVNQRKDKGVSLPASMRNFRFSAAEDAFGNLAIPDSKSRLSAGTRVRAGFRSESHDLGMRGNNSDTSITENGQGNDSGVDTAVSSLQSESPRGSRQSSFSKNSEYDQLSQNSGDTGIFNEDDHYEYDVPSHVLTSFEKSWMMSAMTGNKPEIICQLEEDRSIIKFKDFIMGTALHWAAKQGNEDLVKLLVDGGADVNIKSGYTPLHLATMHGKVNIINILIDEYHANVRIRDHSGKEPKDVVTKNSSEQIKEKLAEPKAAIALEEMAKKFPAIAQTDSSNASGFSRYMEPKDSPKVKPKLKAGASFRFLKKPKKLRRSDRPVIEHWDSSRQERLQSTLESDEKELYKMQRSNSGSLFPTSFYAAKRPSQTQPAEEKLVTVDSPGKLGTTSDEPRERLLSRSYPENEFRNLAQISESDPKETSGDHRSPSGSLSNPTTVESEVLGGKVNHRRSGVGAVFEGDPINRRSYSDNNLNQRFQDELATRLTMDGGTSDRPPSVFADDALNLEITKKSKENGDEEPLRLKIDSSPEKGSLDPFKGEELATFMTVPSNGTGVTTQQEGKSSVLGRVNGNVSGLGEAGKGIIEVEEMKATSTRSFSNEQEGKTKQKARKEKQVRGKQQIQEQQQQLLLQKQKDELKQQQQKEKQQKQQQQEQPQRTKQEERISQNLGAQPGYHNDKVNSKFDNNYKQVSEILTTEEQTNTETSQEEPTSPIRPPRKKDKKLKKSLHVQEDEQDIYNFETGNEQELISTSADIAVEGRGFNSKTDCDTKAKASAHSDNWKASDVMDSRSDVKGSEVYLGRRSQSSNSLNDYRVQSEQFNTNLDHTERRPKGPVGQQGDMNQDFTRENRNQDYTRRKSDGFEGHRAHSEENMYEQHSKLNTRRKSEGFTTRGAHESTSHEEFRKPDSEFVRRKPEGYTDQRKSEGFTDQGKFEGFTSQKEVSLDHPRRSSNEEFLKSDFTRGAHGSTSHEEFRKPDSEFVRRKPEGYTDQRKAEGFTDQGKFEGFTSQKEVSLDHPRRSSNEEFLKSDFTRGAHESTSHEEFRKPDSEFVRRKPEGYTDQRKAEGFTDQGKFEGFTSQKEVSLDHPRRSSNEEFLKSDQEFVRRRSEGFTDQRRTEGFTDQRKSEGFRDERRPEGLRDQRRTEGFTDQRRSEGFRDERRPEGLRDQQRTEDMGAQKYIRRKSEGFTEQRSEPFTDQQRSGSFANQRRSEGFTSQKEVSLDHPRRRTIHSLPPSTNPSESRRVLPEVLLDTSRRASSGNPMRSQDDPGPTKDNTQVDRRVPPPYRPPPGLVKVPPSEGGLYPEQGNRRPSSRPNYMPPPPPVPQDPAPNRKSQEFIDTRPGYPPPKGDLPITAPTTLSQPLYHSSENLSKNTRSVSQPSSPHPLEVSPKAPPRKHRNSIPSEDYPPSEVSPTAPPRKHRASVSRSSEDFDNPTLEVSPTAPPRKHRSSLTRALEDEPTTSTQISRPSYAPPPLPSNLPPPRPKSQGGEVYTVGRTSGPSYSPPSITSNPPPPRPKSQGGEVYTFGRDVSLDHPKLRSQNFEPDDSVVIAARSYEPSQYSNSQPQSSNYRRSEGNEYNTSEHGNFDGHSSNYRRSEGNEFYPSEYGYSQPQSSNYRQSEGMQYNPSEYGDFQPQSSVSRRSEGNDYYPSEYGKRKEHSSNYRQSEGNEYRQSSGPQYSSDSRHNYTSEFSPNFEPTAARDLVDGNESRSLRPRSTVDTTTRDQSPPDEVVLARSVTSEPERDTNYPEYIRNDRREPPDYIPTRKPPEGSGDAGYNIDRRNGTFGQSSYDNEFESVLVPKYDGYSGTEPVLVPKFEGYIESNISRPEINVSRPEQNFGEPEFIVAKEMSSHEGMTEARPFARSSREDMDTLPGTLGQEMKNKWVSNSSDGSNESSENRNKYRMTSMI